MADPKLTELLANMVRANASTRLPNMGQVSGLSQAILSRVPVQNPYKAEEIPSKDPRGPSLVNRVLDVLSRPLYTSLTPVKEELIENKEAIERGDLKAALKGGLDLTSPITQMDRYWEGLSGREKTTGRDILETTGIDEKMPGPANAVAGFAIDVLADPLTYVGGLGLASKVGKGAKTSTELLGQVAEGTAKSSQGIADDIARRAAEQATALDEVIPKPGMPAPKPGDPPRTFIAGPGPEGGLEAFEAANKQPRFKSVFSSDTRQSKPMLELPPAPRDVKSTNPLVQNINEIQQKIAATKSPVAKNALRRDLEKLAAGVKPADIFDEARKVPPQFPDITINPRWAEAAKDVATKFLERNRLTEINHVGQTNLYNSILNAASKVRKDRRAFHVLQMLRVAEDHLLASGRKLTDAEGISVRLSDIANIVGGPRGLNTKLVDDFRRARPSQWTEDVKAFNTPQVASEILDPVVKTAADMAPDIAKLPESQTVTVGSDISKALRNIAKKAGASSREAGAAKSFIDDLFRVDRDKLYDKITQEARELIRQSATGVVNPQSMHRVSEATYRALGANPKVLGRQIPQNKVVEGIMTKFATWWGAKDLKPFSREYIDTARNVAAAFSETLKPIVRSTTPSQRAASWAVATGKRSPSSPEEAALAQQFTYMIQRLMGTHGINDSAESVLVRSGTLLDELNAELPKELKLTSGKGTDKIGRKYDYSKGQWMHSWKEWDIKEPAEALYQLTRALQMVTRKNAMWDDAATRWGMPMRTAEYQHEVANVGRLKGTYFPKQIAQQISNLQSQLDRDVFKAPNKAIKAFDQIQRMWKTGVTIYSPSHHIRNLNGDIYLAALDGVVSPTPYLIASKVLHAYPTRYKDLESVFNIMDPKLKEAALRARPGNVVLTTKRGEKLTAEQLYQAAESQGLFVRAMHAEDIVGDNSPAFGTFGAKFKPFGGHVYGAATKVSELRDHWVRLAHFADVLSKTQSPLPVAIEQAARRVKKFHPDGMDLTGFEQNVMRRIIPFYSWMRKATPLVFEGAVMRPHISLMFPKAMANMQLATGIESQGPGDPFPVDQMFPDWIKEKGVGPILQPGSGLGRDENWRGEAPGYTILNPTNPLLDQIAQVGSPAKTLLSGLTPGARIPIELLTGQTTLGIPLESVEGGVPGHLAMQVPPVGIAARISGATRDNEPWNPEQLINWLTAAGISGTGPYEYQANTEIRELLRQIAEKNRGDYR
jgi:hypothetical protein